VLYLQSGRRFVPKESGTDRISCPFRVPPQNLTLY
jgi:hypothetical protein